MIVVWLERACSLCMCVCLSFFLTLVVQVEGKVRPKHKLHVAVKKGDLDATKDILRSGNDLNVQDHKGRYVAC